METITLKFKVSGQNLTPVECQQNFASNTVNYVKAEFELDDNWKSFDAVRAVWNTDFACIATVLDVDGACTVPHEVLDRIEDVYVNLFGSIVDGDVLTDRLTTYPAQPAIIDAEALILGSETEEITPSQFDQFAGVVRDEADRAEQAMHDAEGFAQDSKDWSDVSEEWAHKAEQSAAQAGYMFFYIDSDDTSPDYGCLIMDRTDNIDVQFSLEDGYLFVEA